MKLQTQFTVPNKELKDLDYIKKVDLLEKLGVIKVSILMDGDDAGRRAAKRIQGLVEKVDIQSKIIDLPYGKDPGDLLQTEIKFLLEEIQ